MRARRPRAVRGLFFLLLTSTACGGGSCAGCGDLAPIPDDYPPDARLERAGTVRITETGLASLGDQVDLLALAGTGDGMMGGPVDVAVPETSGTLSGISYRLCRDGCTTRLEVTDVALTSNPPDELGVGISAVVDSRDPEGGRAGFPLRLRGGCFLGICLINTTCSVDLDSRRGDREALVLEGGVRLAASEVAPREGLLALEATGAAIAPDGGIQGADVRFGSCSGVSGALIELFGGLVEDAIVDALEPEIPRLLEASVEDVFCARRTEAGCPGSSVPVPEDAPDAICRASGDPSSACLPVLAGIQGQGELGAALLGGGLGGTPPIPGQLQIALAGPGESVAGGLSLPLTAGLRTTPSFAFEVGVPAHDACAPITAPPPRPDGPISRPDALDGNVIPGTDTPVDLAVGIAEPFLAETVWALVDAGAFCLEVDHRDEPSLTTGLLGLLLPSLGELAFPVDAAPLQIGLRPGAAPEVTLGVNATEPILTVALPSLRIDLRVWSAGRYVRALTYGVDLTVPLDLVVEGDAIVPRVLEVETANGGIVDAPLLREDAETVGMIFDTAAASLAEGLGAAFPAVALPALPGLALSVPPGGGPQVLVSDDGVRHLAFFADLVPSDDLAPATDGGFVDTSLRVLDIDLHPDGMVPEGLVTGPPNAVTVEVTGLPGGLPTGEPIEHAVRVDGGTWSPWQASPIFTLQDPRLRLQGRHRIAGRARLEDQPATADGAPAVVEVVVDVTPPQVALTQTAAGGVAVDARDLVHPREALRLRSRRGAASWGPWMPVPTELSAAALTGVGALEVEVRDPGGQVGRARLALVADPEPVAGGCAAPGAAPGGRFASLALVLLAVGLRRRRFRGDRSRRDLVAVSAAMLLAACSSSSRPSADPCDGACGEGTACCPASAMCVDVDLDSLCPPGLVCPGPEAVTVDASCAPACEACAPRPPLDPGILAFDLDVGANPAGDGVWLAGYSPGVIGGDRYGDLVVGVLGSDAGAVEWEIVDGVPAELPLADPNGWRGGVALPGDDVGRFARLAVTPDGDALVAYQNATASAVQLARGVPGGEGGWQIGVVDGDAIDAGRGLDLALDGGGRPVLVHQRVTEDPDRPGVFEASLVLSRAIGPTLATPDDWETRVVESSPVACRPEWCDDTACFVDDGRCTAPTDECDGSCETGTACRGGICTEVRFPPTVSARPPWPGSVAALAVAGDWAAVVYEVPVPDAQVVVRLFSLGATVEAVASTVLTGRNPGDGGANVAADVVFEASAGADGPPALQVVWMAQDRLAHARLALVADDGGPRLAVIGSPRTVDDGSRSPESGARHDDGRHRVGRDARLVLDPVGPRVRIVHQDATAATLRVATIPDATDPDAAFDLGRVVPMEGAGGFFPFLVHLDDGRAMIGGLVRDPSNGAGAIRAVVE